MPAKIEKNPRVDTGTGEAKPIGPTTIDLTGDLDGPTGEAKSTLNRNVVVESGEPTGEAKKQGVRTVTADFPAVKEVATSTTVKPAKTESKTTRKSTREATAKKTSRKR